MAAVTPSGSSGSIVEITNTAVAPAYNIVVTSLQVNPGTRVSYTFPDGSTNITFRVRQFGQTARFYSALNATGYFTTDTYSSGSVNTRQVTFCWENDNGVDIELTYWGPAGVADSSGFLLLETGDYLGL